MKKAKKIKPAKEVHDTCKCEVIELLFYSAASRKAFCDYWFCMAGYWLREYEETIDGVADFYASAPRCRNLTHLIVHEVAIFNQAWRCCLASVDPKSAKRKK